MDELVKERSVKSCIALGYQHWQQHLSDTFRGTFMYLLISAVMFTAALISALMSAPIWLSVTLLAVSMFDISRKVRRLSGEKETGKLGKKQIMRNLGYYLSFVCLSSVLRLCVICVISAPLLLLLYMYWLNYETMKAGDPSSLTTTYWVLIGLTAFDTSVAVRFIGTWTAYAELYVYGTMIARKQARKQAKAASLAS